MKCDNVDCENEATHIVNPWTNYYEVVCRVHWWTDPVPLDTPLGQQLLAEYVAHSLNNKLDTIPF